MPLLQQPKSTADTSRVELPAGNRVHGMRRKEAEPNDKRSNLQEADRSYV